MSREVFKIYGAVRFEMNSLNRIDSDKWYEDNHHALEELMLKYHYHFMEDALDMHFRNDGKTLVFDCLTGDTFTFKTIENSKRILNKDCQYIINSIDSQVLNEMDTYGSRDFVSNNIMNIDSITVEDKDGVLGNDCEEFYTGIQETCYYLRSFIENVKPIIIDLDSTLEIRQGDITEDESHRFNNCFRTSTQKTGKCN